MLKPMAAATSFLTVTATTPTATLKMKKNPLASYSSPRYAAKAGAVKNVVTSVLSPPSYKSARTCKFLRSERAEVFKSMEKWAGENILVLLKPVEKAWQPQDLLPDPASDGFFEKVAELQERTKELPDDFFVLLVGEMLTEEALPTYQSLLSATEGFTDETAADPTPFQAWNRGWSAEENRHGDLLNKYLYLSGRVDMKQVEKTTHYLIKAGMNAGTARDPYLFVIYTTFQERVTFLSHGKTANLARKHGDMKLAQICGTIAADEKRHEIAYTRIVDKLFELDPDGAILALEEMMQKRITMPGHLMFDGQDADLFSNFGDVVARLGIYNAADYIDVTEFLVDTWNVEKLTGLSSDGRRAQEYVCGLAQRLKRMQERAQEKAAKASKVRFSWIFDREI